MNNSMKDEAKGRIPVAIKNTAAGSGRSGYSLKSDLVEAVLTKQGIGGVINRVFQSVATSTLIELGHKKIS
ncbi:hypothetical protein [Lactiplantibacillus plantarum]|uniref:hypothetical protein n=1 Tax=Lactiplantibacillus plantarum TaxID=1590 RepID=UPI003F52E077